MLYQSIPTPSSNSEGSTQSCLADRARQTMKQRVTDSGMKPLQNWSQNSRNSTKYSTWRSRKIDQYSRFDEHAQNRIPNRICRCRFWVRQVNSKDSVRNPKNFVNIGKTELYELEEVFKKMHCPSYAKNWPERLQYYTCGICLVSSWVELRTRAKVNSRSCLFRFTSWTRTCSREARHEQSQWQYDPRKAKDSKRNASKKDWKSITDRLHRDDLYRVLSISRFNCDSEYLICRDKKVIAQGMGMILCLEAMIREDRWNTALISHGQVHTLAARWHQERKTNPYILKHMRTCCRHTRRRFECTHGGVLNLRNAQHAHTPHQRAPHPLPLPPDTHCNSENERDLRQLNDVKYHPRRNHNRQVFIFRGGNLRITQQLQLQLQVLILGQDNLRITLRLQLQA